MKMIKSIIPEKKLESLKQALLNDGILGMTVYEAKGFGIRRSQLSRKVSRNYMVEFQPRIVIELVVEDAIVEKTVKLITSVVKTGRLGDGKILILPVEGCIRIRTGERGEAAI